MKRFIACISLCLLLCACSKAPGENTMPTFTRVEATAPTLAETTGPTVPALVETTKPTAPVTPATTPPVHFLTVYAPNEDATGFIYASFELPELTPEAICNALISAKVLNEDVRFNSLTVENGQANLDVNPAFGRQLMSYGTAGEYMMMGSVVNTLLGLPGIETVFITVNGQVLESGHVLYDFPQEFYDDQAV